MLGKERRWGNESVRLWAKGAAEASLPEGGEAPPSDIRPIGGERPTAQLTVWALGISAGVGNGENWVRRERERENH